MLTGNIPCTLISYIRERLRQVHGLTTLFVQALIKCAMHMLYDDTNRIAESKMI